jgi:hypothetical protein
MLTIATGKEVALLLFHTPTKYGSNRFRQIFIDHTSWPLLTMYNILDINQKTGYA